MSEELNVEADPQLSSMEKTTGIGMYGDEEVMSISSSKPTIIRSLLAHDHFEIDWALCMKKGGEMDHVERVESIEEAREYEAIYSVKGSMPIGCLTIKSAPRSNNYQSSIVNSEGIQEGAFDNE